MKQPLIGILTYMGLYGIWGIGINILDIRTNWIRKQKKGGWEKSYIPPFYWDKWSYTHIGWGMAAPLFKVNLPLFTFLNLLNEIVLERILCELVNKGVGGIHFSSKCDPLPHMIADFVYGMVGYGITSVLLSMYTFK